MESNNEFGNITFDLPKNQSNVIKVIGVGGGGSNAINHMFKQGIIGVDFVVCNTDSQALHTSPVPNKIQLGVNLTEGLGAGAKPEVGHQAALESIEDIEKMLDANTKMVFITAGMGGGTGTGAAPVIAQLAKERGILTVGIVTIPFQFEGKSRAEQAMQGVEKLRKQVDSLIVINNNKLREVYGNLGFKAGFAKADEVLATASKGIAEVITNHLTMNIDLKDAKTVLSDSGTAIMGSAIAEGEDRAKEAIVAALDSPLLNDNKISGAKNVLLLITFGSNEITIDEISEINEYIQSEAGHNANIIMGVGEDEKLGDAISVTVIATGFNVEQQIEIVNAEPKRIIHTLEGEQKVVQSFSSEPVVAPTTIDQPLSIPVAQTPVVEEEKVVFNLEAAIEDALPKHNFVSDLVPTTDFIKNLDVFFEIVTPKVEVAQPLHTEIPVAKTDLPLKKEIPQFEVFSAPEPVKEMQVIEPQMLSATDDFEFELDLFSEEEIQATNEIKVNQPVQVVPVTEVNQDGVIRYTLEEEIELVAEPTFEAKVEEKIVEEELNFTMKTTEEAEAAITFEASPIEMSIEDALKARVEERKRKLKDFNYKFNNPSRIEELEKEPAFKRQGLDVTSMPNTNNQSRMSLGTDSNDDLQLRSNNSFLHDNVD
jgi:cell division protein FtsZ